MNHLPTPEEDDAIFAILRSGTPTPSQLQGLRDRLWWYGWIVMRGHLGSGTMGTIRLSHPHRGITGAEAEQLRYSKDLREEIAADALLEAVPRFITNLSSGRSWDPTYADRASILTYWINALASETYVQVGRWANQQHRIRYEAIRVETLVNTPSEPGVDVDDDDFATRLAQRKTLRELLPAAREGRIDRSTVDLRAIAAMMLAGYEPTQIAERLRLKVRRVWHLTSGLRDLAWRHVARGIFDTRVFPEVREHIEGLVERGLSPKQIARELKITLATATELWENWGGLE